LTSKRSNNQERSMKKFLYIVFVFLLFPSCKDNNITSQIAVLDEPFRLKLGQAKILHSENLIVRFSELVGDSRCPEDVVCVLAGEAEIELWLLKPAQDTTFFSLAISGFVNAESEHHVSTDTLDYRIMLQQLDPYPNTSRQRRLSDYEALLVISNSN